MDKRRSIELSQRASLLLRWFESNGASPALISPDRTLTYAELASKVEAASRSIGAARQLVMVRLGNDIESIVWYLACLAGGHPALLTSASDDGLAESLVAAYRPGLTVRTDGADIAVTNVGEDPTSALHPSLGVMLTTSGTTGSPKLVRLSRRNLVANARSIASYLELTPADRAITLLPPHYCYGLSVINSHLAVGASIVVNDSSVIDQSFWSLLEQTEATSFAGVPYTFELLERVGFAGLHLPSLRYVTQAGGRLPPERVRALARLGEERGWRFYVMYGQTEATARMAYLPPDRAMDRPSSIGIPIPGGSFEIDDTTTATNPDLANEGNQRPTAEPPDRGQHGPASGRVGELIYRGPNVMLGYAESPDDLAKGRSVTALRTGDLARQGADGLYEIVGRRSRFVKVYGQRIELDHLESELRSAGLETLLVGDDETVVVASEHGHAESGRDMVIERTGLPADRVEAVELESLPRTEAGKVDIGALMDMARARRSARQRSASDQEASLDTVAAICGLYARTLRAPDAGPSDSFTGLGGDSLSYVSLSIDLEDLIGTLPTDWHLMSIASLAATARPRGRWRQIDTTIVLRAVSIVLIVATHTRFATLPAGGHVLLGVAGYNYARFQLGRPGHRTALARVAIPSIIWIGALWLITDDYPFASIFLVHNTIGEAAWSAPWRYWFIEVLVHLMLGAWLLKTIRPVDRLQRGKPFAFAAGLVILSVLLRWDPLDLFLDSRDAGRTLTTMWAFTIGWAAAVASTHRERLFVMAAVPVAAFEFFNNDVRNAMIVAGFWILLWIPRLTVPKLLLRPVGLLAGASLYIYLTHWEVYLPVRRASGPLLATAVSLLVGVLVWRLATAVERALPKRPGRPGRASTAASSSIREA